MTDKEISTTQIYYRKDFDDTYGDQYRDDYIASQELTVTITLHEYRKLIGTSLTSETKLSEANSARWKAESKAGELKKENDELRKKLVAGVIKNNSDEEPDDDDED